MKILIVSPYFAPFLGVGALRMSSFVKYLLTQNDEVSVVKYCDEIHSSDMIGSERIDGVDYTEVFANLKSPFGDLSNIFYNTLDKLLSEKTFDVLFCSAGPFYTISAVEKISKKYGVPYVLDYRDLWIYDDRKVSGITNKLRHKIFKIRYKKYEKSATQNANLFVTVSPLALEIMEKKYKLQNSHVIFNGYDDNALKDIVVSDKKESDTFEICFFGKLSYYSYSHALNYLKAVKGLIDEGYDLAIKHISENESSTQKIIDEIDFPRDRYICTGRKNYKDGMEVLKESNISAAILSYKRGLGTKIFDYIFVGKPIVAIAPPSGDFDNLANNYENLYVCQNEEQVKQSIKKIVDLKITTLGKNINAEIYSRYNQNKKYRDLIQKCLEQNRD